MPRGELIRQTGMPQLVAGGMKRFEILMDLGDVSDVTTPATGARHHFPHLPLQDLKGPVVVRPSMHSSFHLVNERANSPFISFSEVIRYLSAVTRPSS